jgi:hypothetical protein
MSSKNKGKKPPKNAETASNADEDPSDLHENNDTSDTIDTSLEFAENLAKALKRHEVKSGFQEMLKPLIFHEVQKQTSSFSTKLESVSDKTDSLELDFVSKNLELENKIKDLELQYQQAKSSLSDFDRKLKACNVKITGVTLPNTFDTLFEKQSAYKEKLMKLVTDADITGVSPLDISTISFGKGHENNFTIVTLINEHVKNNLYLQRTKLKKLGGKIYINEDLTREDSKIFKRAREEVKSQKLHSTWTRYGKVYGKLTESGKPFVIDK